MAGWREFEGFSAERSRSFLGEIATPEPVNRVFVKEINIFIMGKNWPHTVWGSPVDQRCRVVRKEGSDPGLGKPWSDNRTLKRISSLG